MLRREIGEGGRRGGGAGGRKGGEGPRKREGRGKGCEEQEFMVGVAE